MKILIVEDEKKISDLIEEGLKGVGYDVVAESDGDRGLKTALGERFDVIILDVMLPGRDGFSILKALKEAGHTEPILLLTARSDVQDRVDGLNLGADDYLTKPFYMEELLARISAIARRSEGGGSTLESGMFRIDFMKREVMRHEETVYLSTKEFDLFSLLIRSPGDVFSRAQILEHVWGYTFDPGTNSVDVYIRRLREKVDRDGEPSCIETIRGVGYRFRGSPA